MRSPEFQQLIELVDIITKYKVRQIEVIGNPKNNGGDASRYWDFYEKLSDGILQNDSEAAIHFGLDEDSRNYRRLREGLLEKLLNTLIFVDVTNSEFYPSQIAYYSLWKEYAALKIAHGRGGRFISINLAKKLLKTAMRFEFTEATVDLARILKSYYSKDPEKQKEYGEYSEIMWQNLKMQEYEILAQECYEKLIMPYVVTKAPKEETSKLAHEYIEKLDQTPKTLRTRMFQIYYYSIKVAEVMSANQWKTTVEVCEEAIQILGKDESFSKRVISLFLHQQIVAFTMLGNYQKAEEKVLESLRHLPAYSNNWFKAHELYIMLLLHSDQFQKAWETSKPLLKHPRMESLYQPDKEMWRVYEAYLHLLVALDKIQLSPREKGESKKFRVSKLLNEVPVFSKDKRGMNIPLLIVQIFFLLLDDRFDEADYRIEAVMKYYQRHLKEDDQSYRTNCFLKMLEALKSSGFDKRIAPEKIESWMSKLEKIPLDISSQAHEIEVIPYPRQWQLGLECLVKGR